MRAQERYFNLELIKDNKGSITPMLCPQAWLDSQLEHFEARIDDVIIATYPRAGCTWMRQIVHLLSNEGEQGDLTFESTTPYLEAVGDYLSGDNVDKIIKGYQTKKSPRHFATHLRHKFITSIVNYQQAKYIYVCRNPKDCMVSAYRFISKDPTIQYGGTWDDFFELYISGHFEHGMILDHVSEWWKACIEMDNLLFVSYQAMQENLTGAVQTVADFLNIPASPSLINTVVEKSQSKSMKINSLANTNRQASGNRSAEFNPLRKGMAGDWKNYFSPLQNEIFNNLQQEKLGSAELPFQIELK